MPWRSQYSDEPCRRDYFGAPVGVTDTDMWWEFTIWTKPSSEVWVYNSDHIYQVSYEYCGFDYVENGNYNGGMITHSGPYGDGNKFRRYIKFDFVKASGHDAAAHNLYWNRHMHNVMRDWRRFTDMINLYTNYGLGIDTKLHYTDPS